MASLSSDDPKLIDKLLTLLSSKHMSNVQLFGVGINIIKECNGFDLPRGKDAHGI